MTAAEPASPQGGDAVASVLGERYRLGAVLGRGGMADVYRATDLLLDRQVAVKVLRGSADNDSDLARFTAEARTLASLSHSGVVMVLDAGTTAEHPFIVMELVEGPTLAKVLETGPVDAEHAGSLGVQLAEALAYAHERGVVHRDVKPGNVLLGPDGRVKLADFGIARLLGETVRHTRTGQAIGTAAYLAPEQVMGRDVDGAADVYALGLVLLEAVTGVRAYPGTPTEAAMARLSRPPDVPPDLSPDLRQLLTAMTALEPDERPSAADVAASLRRQPTGPVPVATVRHPPADPVTAVLPAPAGPPPSTSVAQPAQPLPDRAGDAVAAWARRTAQRARSLPPHQKAIAAAVGALLLLIVIVAVVGSGSGAGSGGHPPPSNTPPGLRQPLERLHSAVDGG